MPSSSPLKRKLPLLAMTPRLFSRSFSSMPMPLSLTVRVRLSLSMVSVIWKSSRRIPTLSSVRLR